jgi:hypothetical protein
LSSITLLTAICRSTLHTVIAIHKITKKFKKKTVVKSHLVISEIPRHVTTYILNYTTSR